MGSVRAGTKDSSLVHFGRYVPMAGTQFWLIVSLTESDIRSRKKDDIVGTSN